MVTTSSFPNLATPSPNDDIERNSLTKEDLEGAIKKTIQHPLQNNVNGGNCCGIEI